MEYWDWFVDMCVWEVATDALGLDECDDCGEEEEDCACERRT